MSMDTPDTAPRRSRWLYGALIASLAVNLLVIGGTASAFWVHRHGHDRRGAERGLMGFVRELPDSRRAVIGDYLKAEKEKILPLREAISAGWNETNSLLIEEPFDKDKLKAAMARMVDAEMRMRGAISDALVETAEKLSPEERKALKAWRENRRAGWGRWADMRDKERHGKAERE